MIQLPEIKNVDQTSDINIIINEEDEQKECTICLNYISKQNQTITTCCKNILCGECVSKWSDTCYANNQLLSCPYCRNIVSDQRILLDGDRSYDPYVDSNNDDRGFVEKDVASSLHFLFFAGMSFFDAMITNRYRLFGEKCGVESNDSWIISYIYMMLFFVLGVICVRYMYKALAPHLAINRYIIYVVMIIEYIMVLMLYLIYLPMVFPPPDHSQLPDEVCTNQYNELCGELQNICIMYQIIIIFSALFLCCSDRIDSQNDRQNDRQNDSQINNNRNNYQRRILR